MLKSFDEMPAQARVWIYQNTRKIDGSLLPAIRQSIQIFLESWTSHNQALWAAGDVLYQKFIVIMADESKAGASGCALDRATHFIEQLNQQFELNLFDRTQVAYLSNDTIHDIKTAELQELRQMYRDHKIDHNTWVFDNLVATKAEFENNWIKALNKSWHKRFTI